MKEIWKDIKGYEGIYEVSSWGRVRSLDREITKNQKGILCTALQKGRIRTLHKHKNGYYFVMLYNNGKHQSVRIHRLVAEAFLPNPDNLPCVNHKDETRTNNHVENLEWCTQKYNLNYGTFPERKARLASHIVEELKDGKVIATYTNSIEAAGNVGCSPTAVRYVCQGKSQSIRGRVFRYQKKT